MGNGKNLKNLIRMTVLIVTLFLWLGSASARQFELGQDTTLNFDVTVSFGSGIRVPEIDDLFDSKSKVDLPDPTDPAYQAAINQDDASQNFDYWEFMNNKATAIADIELSYKDVGVFVRPKAFYNLVYMIDNSNDSPDTNNAYQGGLIDSSDQWADEIEDIHGMDAEILDFYGYWYFRLFDRDFEIRVGKQVISWGESLLLAGGISSAQNPLDVSVAQIVGTEVKEILMPTGAAYLQVGITEALSINGYYQYDWEKSRLMEGGTFFAQGDMLDEIRAPQLAPPYSPVPRGDDDEARKDGQFGINTMYVLPWLDATEVGVYYLNYHAKTPVLLMPDFALVPSGGATYYTYYPEDIKLYGVSVGSIVGPVQVSGEFSYRQDIVLQGFNAFGVPIAEEGDYWQAQTSATYTTPLPFFADSLNLVGEVAMGRQVDVGEYHRDEFSWSYSAIAMFDWYQVIPKLDLGLNLANSDTMVNTSLAGAAEGSAAFSITFDLIYNLVWKAGLTYENRYNRNALKDRDTVSFNLSYTF